MMEKWHLSASVLSLLLLLLRAGQDGPVAINRRSCTGLPPHGPSDAPYPIFFGPALPICPRLSAILTWESTQPLGPVYRRKSISLALLNYWLLLTAGDIEVNPGPVKHPCGICSRPVKRNQKGIQCECCYYWLHTKCLKMPADEYSSLAQSDEPWCCSTCLREALPFHSCSDTLFDHSLPGDLPPPPQPLAIPQYNHHCSIYYSNCRSLLPKLDILRAQAISTNPGIIALVETWLDPSISTQEVAIPGYSCIRRDRHRHGGGIILYVRNDIRVLSSSLHPTLELLFANLQLKQETLAFGLYYRPTRRLQLSPSAGFRPGRPSLHKF